MDKFFGYSLEGVEFMFNCERLKLVQLRDENKESYNNRLPNKYVCLFFRNLKDYDVELCFTSESEALKVYNYFKNYIERGCLRRVK